MEWLIFILALGIYGAIVKHQNTKHFRALAKKLRKP